MVKKQKFLMNKLPEIDLPKLSITKKIGQLFMAAAFINDSEKEFQKLEKLISEHHIGALCFFHSRASAATNFEKKVDAVTSEKIKVNQSSFEALKKLIHRFQNAATFPLLIAIDAEWGLSMRIENTPQYPHAITIGAAISQPELSFEVGKQIAKDCKAAGIHWNLAPVVDINTNPKNPVIGYRSFGDDKKNVLALAKAYIKGSQSENILTSIKHFPGHGDTAIDSHLGLPVIDKTRKELLKTELFPFQELINLDIDSIMTGHLSLPALTSDKNVPSSINKDIVTGLLRHQMGFKGLIISDALNMHAVSKNYATPGKLEWLAFRAGNDMLCFSEHIENGKQTILKNASELQINKSFERLWKLKKRIFKNQTQKGHLNLKSEASLTNPSALNRKIAEKSLTFLYGNINAIDKFRKTEFYTINWVLKKDNLSKKERLNSWNNLKNKVCNEDHILLRLTPPSMKPKNNFGFLNDEINFINNLILTKNVVFYHFGNPYALVNFKIKQTIATIIAYEDFKEFKNVANEHFLGKLEAIGNLPIKLK